MLVAYIVATVIAAACSGYAAFADFRRPDWILANMTRYGVPHSWLLGLGAIKGLGALGLLAGLAVPALAVVTAACLVVYYLCALATITRARAYSHLAFPLPFLLPAAAALALRLCS